MEPRAHGREDTRALKEAVPLRWEDVDLAEGFIRFRSTKGDEPRSTPMTPRLHQAMREHFRRYRFAQYDGKPSPWIFHHLPRYRTGRSKPGELVRSGFRSRWERLRDDMGLQGTPRHDLRHRRVTQWVAEGHPISVVGEAVGHSSPQVTAHYAHLDREHLRQPVEPTGATKAG